MERPLAGLQPLVAPDTICCNRFRSLTSLASSAAHLLAVALAIPRALGTATALLNVRTDCLNAAGPSEELQTGAGGRESTRSRDPAGGLMQTGEGRPTRMQWPAQCTTPVDRRAGPADARRGPSVCGSREAHARCISAPVNANCKVLRAVLCHRIGAARRLRPSAAATAGH